MKKERIINDDELEEVSGGYIFHRYESGNGYIVEGADPYEVIDDKGNVVERFSTYAKAVRYAIDHGYSDETIDWSQLKEIRDKNK